MPFINKSNNRVLPANARAVDVAKHMIREIAPVQQRRYHNAFEVQGYEAVVYNRLSQGQPCSCQSNRKTLAGLLNEDGKMPEGAINELLTGGLEFSVNRYGTTRTGPHPVDRPQPGAPETARRNHFFGEHISENQTPFEMVGNARDIPNDPYMDVTRPDGTNGPNQDLTLDDLAADFDGEILELGGSRCTCCFGTGFVGGYSVLHGWRKVIAPHTSEVYKVEGTIEPNQRPNAFLATAVEMDVVLPKGFVSLDAFRFWNNVDNVQPDRLLLDGLPYSANLLRALCDGRSHKLRVEFAESTYFTHLEIQINLSRQSSLIEFPRLTQTSNISLTDLTGSVQVNASPMIPYINTQDVLIESTFGKAFLIGTTNLWNDKDRNVHGWDCEARVIQKTELLTLLPRRRKLNQRATHMVRDNTDGIRRT